MKYQIRSNEVKEYIKLMKEKLDDLDRIIDEKEKYMNKNVIWTSPSGTACKNLFNDNIRNERFFVDVISIFLKVYEHGIGNYGSSYEEIKKEFLRLKDENSEMLKRRYNL